MEEIVHSEHIFNERYEEINRELDKRRSRWTLHANPSIDFDDIKQIIFLHIFKKIHLWDRNKEFLPWVNTVISHQIINLLRNHYTNLARPCVSCSANEGEDRCRIYKTQCNQCPLYAHWEKGKKNAFNIKLPVSMEHHSQEVYSIPNVESDLASQINCMHEVMKSSLSPLQYRIYKALYIEGKNEDEVALMMGYMTTERHRKAGYKQLATVNKIIKEKAKLLIQEGAC